MTDSRTARQRIVVVGGGISGLAAAESLAAARRAGAGIEELLIESSARLGGVVRTERVDGFVLEAGPDSFLTEKPEAARLSRQLGLGASLVGSNDAGRRTYILHRGRLVPLPDGLMMLVPTRVWPVVATPLLPVRAKLLAATEWLRCSRPRSSASADESVADFIRRHFGQDLLENIAAPLLSGVYGGDCESLSARSALPRFWEMERRYGSLTRAVLIARRMHRSVRKTRAAPPLFTTLAEGLESLASALEARLEPACIQRGRRVISIERTERGYRLRTGDGAAIESSALILALPAHQCGRLLAGLDAALGEHLGAIPYTDAMTVALAYGAGVREVLPPGFGFLVPRAARRPLLACTFVHAKFPGRAPDGHALLRCFLGGAANPQVLQLSDVEVLKAVRQELRSILGLDQEPLFERVYRWPAAMAQYVVGHEARLAAIQERLRGLPGLFLAGNAYRGIGLSDCIRTGQSAAEQAMEAVSALPARESHGATEYRNARLA